MYFERRKCCSGAKLKYENEIIKNEPLKDHSNGTELAPNITLLAMHRGQKLSLVCIQKIPTDFFCKHRIITHHLWITNIIGSGVA